MPLNPGNTVIRNENLRRLRDLSFLKMKLETNCSNKLIAKHFNLDVRTVASGLTRVARTELLQQFEDELLKNLVPLAMDAIKNALETGNETVALEILKGCNVLKKPGSVIPSGDGDELEVHIRAKRSRSAQTEVDAGNSLPPPEITIEALAEAVGSVVGEGYLAGNYPGERFSPGDGADQADNEPD